MKRLVVVGLACFAASAAHAQTVGPSTPARPPVQGPVLPGGSQSSAQNLVQATPCQLVSKAINDQYVDSPLVGFDPSSSALLPIVPANAGASMVLCSRDTLVPQVTDYRVLTEMHLPLAIKSGDNTLFLGLKAGQIEFGLDDPTATSDEMTALHARRDEMQAAMAAKTAGKTAAK